MKHLLTILIPARQRGICFWEDQNSVRSILSMDTSTASYTERHTVTYDAGTKLYHVDDCRGCGIEEAAQLLWAGIQFSTVEAYWLLMLKRYHAMADADVIFGTNQMLAE